MIDGGGSLGAVVQKDRNWRHSRRHRFDRSTLPLWALEHEIPIYTAMVPKDFLRNRRRK